MSMSRVPAPKIAGWLLLSCLLGMPSALAATGFVEEVRIIADPAEGERIPGAVAVLDLQDLERFQFADVQQMLRQLPGVTLQIEDGYGLRPNISIRGVATERSGRITLLEDNVLIAPAPYSAPSAYYFPTPGRMAALEVVKGPAALSQGPYTIGGALNLVSTPIPNERGGRALLEVGQDATYRGHLTYGDRLENGFGYLLETHQWRSDGFQSIDRAGGDTGLDVRDYTVKLEYAPADSRHRFGLKLQYADQSSEQSYLGLTDADFARDAFRRYGASELDTIDTEHTQIIVQYGFQASDTLSLSATLYNNEHERAWFKTEGLDFDGSTDAQSFSRTSWANVVAAINTGAAIGSASAAELNAILAAGADTAVGAIQVRNNAREYYSRGVQIGGDWRIEGGRINQRLRFGIRYHEDEEDRLQRNSTYSQLNGRLALADRGLLGNAGNRVQQAEALSLYLTNEIEVGNWLLTPGVRFEDIDQSRVRYEIRPDRTTNPAARGADAVRDRRENNTSIVLPGLGVIRTLNDSLSLVAGIHKGFSAPTNAPGVDPEEAINMELGLRFGSERGDGFWRGEVFAFRSDYENLLGVCTASSGSDCEVGDAFNGDAVLVQGLEANLAASFAVGGGWALPLRVAYTYTDAEFETDIAATDFFGDVAQGDPVPYLPEHQLNLTLGLERGRISAFLQANYADGVCVRPSCGAFERTDDSLFFNLSGSYQYNERARFFMRVENLGDEEEIAGRQPYGARPFKDRFTTLGVQVDL